MKFTLIDAENAQWPIRKMCRALGVSPSGYYAWRKREACRRDREAVRLGVAINAVYEKNQRAYGSPRVLRALKKSGEKISRKRVIRLMQQHGLVGRRRAMFVTTTDSSHALSVAENLLQRDFNASAPNVKWATDTTYLKTPHGIAYLAVVMDLFSRAIVG